MVGARVTGLYLPCPPLPPVYCGKFPVFRGIELVISVTKSLYRSYLKIPDNKEVTGSWRCPSFMDGVMKGRMGHPNNQFLDGLLFIH
jgi:hypothetical protein